MTWSLPRSKSWKSSLPNPPTGLPALSRTTTGTITRLTRERKVAGSSFVDISAAFCAGVGGAASCPKAAARHTKTGSANRWHMFHSVYCLRGGDVNERVEGYQGDR